jgi:hypothetical protein
MIAGLTRQKEELKAIIPHKEESLIRAVLPLTSIKVTNFISTDRQLLGTCRSAFHRKLPTLLFISDTSVQKIAAYSDILLPTLLRAHKKPSFRRSPEKTNHLIEKSRRTGLHLSFDGLQRWKP